MSLFLAIGYLGFLAAIYIGMVKFLKYKKSKKTTSYFKFEETQVYNSLVDKEANVKDISKALMRRAIANIKHVYQLREDKQAVATLLKYGSVGDNLWREISDAEEVLNKEIMDTMGSANEIRQGWGSTIFQEAQQFVQTEQQKIQKEQQKKAEEAMQKAKQNKT